jgi:V/A-type H+/Na+-transporting ATPase subunit F
MNSIAVIGDVDTVTGFKLGGIKEGYAVKSPEEAETTLRTLIKENFSIIIITEKIGDELREVIEGFTKSSALPMIIEIPDKSGPSERAVDPMRDLIKRVIGVEMVK